MISDDKRRRALQALNAVLVGARSMACDKAPHSEMAEVLDGAERAHEFRGMLVGLAHRFDVFKRALERFDRQP